jgi:hypothetical protein
MVNSNLLILGWPQNRRKFKSNDIDHNFQVFEIKESDINHYNLSKVFLEISLNNACSLYM